MDVGLECRPVRVEQVELQLDADLGGVAELGQLCEHPPQYRTGIQL